MVFVNFDLTEMEEVNNNFDLVFSFAINLYLTGLSGVSTYHITIDCDDQENVTNTVESIVFKYIFLLHFLENRSYHD